MMFPRPARERGSHGSSTPPGESSQPDFVTKACLVGAALLPWFALFSGTYGLYFYVALAAVLLAPWLLVPALALAAPLAGLLLLIMPAGACRAAQGHPLAGWADRLTKAGCVVSMIFAVAYGGLMLAIAVASVFGNSEAVGWDFSLTWRAGSLVIGLSVTWRAWRWLSR